jgi:hypothetical protein
LLWEEWLAEVDDGSWSRAEVEHNLTEMSNLLEVIEPKPLDMEDLTFEEIKKIAHSSGYGTTDWTSASFMRKYEHGYIYEIVYTGLDNGEEKGQVYIKYDSSGNLTLEF